MQIIQRMEGFQGLTAERDIRIARLYLNPLQLVVQTVQLSKRLHILYGSTRW